ncbi:hypothetical protein ACHAWF_018583 [Thalassiosira exigua]
MQLLLKLAGLAFVAASSVHALDFPKLILRGSPEKDDAFVELENVCRQGEREGRNAMSRAWRRMGENCDDTIGRNNRLRQESRRLSDGFNGGNWRKRESNRCARNGVEAEEQAILKKCLDTNTDVCTDLAKAAAFRIVSANTHRDSRCEPVGRMSSRNTNYRSECRQMAIDTCPGEITTEWRNVCGSSPSGSIFRDMRNECSSTVRNLLRSEEVADVEEEAM